MCACVCACRSCDREGRKNKGGGEKDREVKTVVWIKLSIRMYQPYARFFPQNMMFRYSSICAMKSVPGRIWQRTPQINGLSLVFRHGDIIMKTASFGITDG